MTSSSLSTAGLVSTSEQMSVDGTELIGPLVPVHHRRVLSYLKSLLNLSQFLTVLYVNHFYLLQVNYMVRTGYMEMCVAVFTGSHAKIVKWYTWEKQAESLAHEWPNIRKTPKTAHKYSHKRNENKLK